MVASPVATWLSVATWFVILLWKQLNHLGIAGFGPETFRLDPYVNVSVDGSEAGLLKPHRPPSFFKV
ncbi:hypothetical protein HanIR_Chr04g0189341 [Helianthus annuus]|nr:hypothetical protein HanIR_Chr04g0189341 [Helianthus annuus]